MGHCLATYTLSGYFSKPASGVATSIPDSAEGEEDGEETLGSESTPIVVDTSVPGGWEHVVTEAVQSTRITYPVRAYYYLSFSMYIIVYI